MINSQDTPKEEFGQQKNLLVDDEDESEESSSSSEDNQQQNVKAMKKSMQDDGDVSSVTTRQNKTERNHFILRMAIDEKYIPTSIKNLRVAAYIVFFILLVLAIVYYAIQISLYDQINQNIKNIDNSEKRLNYIIDITLQTRYFIMVNRGYMEYNEYQLDETVDKVIDMIRNASSNLKEAQTDLSLSTANLDADKKQQINPDNVMLLYYKYPNLPNIYYLSIWEAIMEIVVSAFRISTNPNNITDQYPSAYFIIHNCLNSVLTSLKSSTSAIIEFSNESRETNLQIFQYVLIAASCSLFFSLVFLIPVINKVKKNKQEVLELFINKNIERSIDEQLKICRNFVQMKLQQNNRNMAEEDMNNENETQMEINNNKYMKRIKKKNKGKKWKKLNSTFGSTIFKFFIFICIILGYYLTVYLLSYKFLHEVSDLTSELKLLIQRSPTQSFLLLIQIELIYSNGTSLIESQNSIEYVEEYQSTLYDEEEDLLDKFSLNYNYHSETYNTEFNNIIYSNVCEYAPFINKTACQEFNKGILQKGLYSSVIKYWDLLRQLEHDFLLSNRTEDDIISFINDDRLLIAKQMQSYYIKVAMDMLVTQLEYDIDIYFEQQNVSNRTIFIIYIIYIVLLYMLVWRKFVHLMQNELWKTKSMLSVLPTKLCFEIEDIRNFIYSNSSNDFLSAKI